MKQWQYSPDTDSAITEVETEDVVMYVDTINPDVIIQLVIMHNEEYSLRKIKDYLESDERVTPDEVEFLMEELEKYEELEKKAGTTTVCNNSNMEGGDLYQGEKEAPFPHNLEEQSIITKQQEELKKTIMEENTGTADVVVGAAKIRKTKGSGTTGKKKMSLEDMIQEMESKIELAKVFQNIPEIPFPENMGKSARDLMLRFQKEYKELVERFIVEIQEM